MKLAIASEFQSRYGLDMRKLLPSLLLLSCP
jgi:hypothetical protein